MMVGRTSRLHITPVETIDYDLADTRLNRVFVEGGGLKLGFGDENVEIDLQLKPSSSSAHMW
jgi:hypothetical protein